MRLSQHRIPVTPLSSERAGEEVKNSTTPAAPNLVRASESFCQSVLEIASCLLICTTAACRWRERKHLWIHAWLQTLWPPLERWQAGNSSDTQVQGILRLSGASVYRNSYKKLYEFKGLLPESIASASTLSGPPCLLLWFKINPPLHDAVKSLKISSNKVRDVTLNRHVSNERNIN